MPAVSSSANVGSGPPRAPPPAARRAASAADIVAPAAAPAPDEDAHLAPSGRDAPEDAAPPETALPPDPPALPPSPFVLPSPAGAGLFTAPGKPPPRFAFSLSSCTQYSRTMRSMGRAEPSVTSRPLAPVGTVSEPFRFCGRTAAPGSGGMPGGFAGMCEPAAIVVADAPFCKLGRQIGISF